MHNAGHAKQNRLLHVMCPQGAATHRGPTQGRQAGQGRGAGQAVSTCHDVDVHIELRAE